MSARASRTVTPASALTIPGEIVDAVGYRLSVQIYGNRTRRIPAALPDEPPLDESSRASRSWARRNQRWPPGTSSLAVVAAAEGGDPPAERGRGERVGACSDDRARKAAFAELLEFLPQVDCAYLHPEPASQQRVEEHRAPLVPPRAAGTSPPRRAARSPRTSAARAS